MEESLFSQSIPIIMRLLIIIYCLLTTCVSAQVTNPDLIITTKGDSIRCKITDILTDRITWLDQEAQSIYQSSRADVQRYVLGYFRYAPRIRQPRNPIKHDNNMQTTGLVITGIGAVWLGINQFISDGWTADAIRASNTAGFALIAAGSVIQIAGINIMSNNTAIGIAVAPSSVAIACRF
jgi:hypothetical protein